MSPNNPPASAPASGATELSPSSLTGTAARPSCGETNLPGAKAHQVIKLDVDVHGRDETETEACEHVSGFARPHAERTAHLDPRSIRAMLLYQSP